MPYVVKWSDLPEVEILKGNFRRSASGLKGSVNKIRLSHPSETPVHHHAEEEQTVLMLSGEMDVVIDKDTIRLGPDQVVSSRPAFRIAFAVSLAKRCFWKRFRRGASRT